MRGGLASALVEIAETAGVAMSLKEQMIPFREDVRSACELLGLGPLRVANEGRFVAFRARSISSGRMKSRAALSSSARSRPAQLARFPVVDDWRLLAP
jgi:hydrogenase maturation factor